MRKFIAKLRAFFQREFEREDWLYDVPGPEEVERMKADAGWQKMLDEQDKQDAPK